MQKIYGEFIAVGFLVLVFPIFLALEGAASVWVIVFEVSAEDSHVDGDF